jgi:hypothetical protein
VAWMNLEMLIVGARSPGEYGNKDVSLRWLHHAGARQNWPATVPPRISSSIWILLLAYSDLGSIHPALTVGCLSYIPEGRPSECSGRGMPSTAAWPGYLILDR